ncbi:hypothetical protein HGT71_09730 [Rosenbergiella epipactidis]|nr:hypothetical protein [Rosenbergiella epipactidis]
MRFTPNTSIFSRLRIAVPVLAGLTALHALVPPHPGPIIAITTLHADLLLAWGVAVLIRQATGSATVATTTTAGIMAASFHLLPPLESSLLALAIGAGSVFFCHINDAAYWMIKSFFGLTLRQTLWIWSVLQTIVSLVGLITASALWMILVPS